MAKAKAKELTRDAALALAKAKWSTAFVHYGAVRGYQIGYYVGTAKWIVGQSPKSWRAACEQAGLTND